MQVVNSTYALWTWHRNQDTYKDDSHGDQIYIVRQPELCPTVSKVISYALTSNILMFLLFSSRQMLIPCSQINLYVSADGNKKALCSTFFT